MILNFEAISVNILEGQKRNQISESPNGVAVGQLQCNLGYFSKGNDVQRTECQPTSLVCCSSLVCYFANGQESPNSVVRDRNGWCDRWVQTTTFVGNCKKGILYSRLEYNFHMNILSASYYLLFLSLKNCYGILCYVTWFSTWQFIQLHNVQISLRYVLICICSILRGCVRSVMVLKWQVLKCKATIIR